MTPATTTMASPAPLEGTDLEYLCAIEAHFGDVVTAPTPTGTRMLFPVTHGSVTGPRLAGRIVPGSIDWVTVGADGVGRIDVHALVETQDGARIELTATGRAVLGERTTAFLAGEEVLGRDAYLRISPLFQTSDARYAWLNEIVAVARCDLSPARIRYQVSRVR
ncbi:Protein of unknown function [Pseudonocardia thermophila]|jgi:Protein of unknown function (DUF3237).|uniref:UPF0311 protein SAMN05443637_111169 n=1 Tax=Pseudonocardia thermophila TaxID=1848 RepID=A0A1M6V319_PSETH|nr:DUF3237 domain-containing protein [Pseudonocardia thermophila]SHK75907.1 Protein of unknown function [Pseudonocardia thermophila]